MSIGCRISEEVESRTAAVWHCHFLHLSPPEGVVWIVDHSEVESRTVGLLCVAAHCLFLHLSPHPRGGGVVWIFDQ